jgi:hypothetical protein
MIAKRGASITGEGAAIGTLVRNSLDRPGLDMTRPDCEVRTQTCAFRRWRHGLIGQVPLVSGHTDRAHLAELECSTAKSW